jgi:hypothetical protein
MIPLSDIELSQELNSLLDTGVGVNVQFTNNSGDVYYFPYQVSYGRPYIVGRKQLYIVIDYAGYTGSINVRVDIFYNPNQVTTNEI